MTLLGCETKAESKPPPAAAGVSSTPTTGSEPTEPEEPQLVGPEAKSAAERLLEQVLAIETFEKAVAFARPRMTDTRNEDSVGTTLLALWAQGNLRWANVQVDKDETSIKLARKDPDAARGKRFCYSGRIVQIEKMSKASPQPVWVGLLSTRRRDIIRFHAAGSSGDLVDGSKARLCGVVTGTFSYDNSGGGTTHAVSVVGMFKLPANIERQ